ncbi:VOC family protein [Bacillus sp. SCS-151]|uniref:VOC family protein n=1 Tax=Nanhaiella sioensis TaxID=3115293 RepID=UPI00397AB8F8
MSTFIQRVGTTYVPVADPQKASEWYQQNLGAKETFSNHDKVILDLANQSFFLVKAKQGERVGFLDYNGYEHFTMTFEVNGYSELANFHTLLKSKGVSVGEIEDRGHPGNNFVFYDLNGNKFDVWSELSPMFKEKYQVD